MNRTEMGRAIKCTGENCTARHSIRQLLDAAEQRDDKILRCPTCGARRGDVT
jgi:hypothetical protein